MLEATRGLLPEPAQVLVSPALDQYVPPARGGPPSRLIHATGTEASMRTSRRTARTSPSATLTR